MNYLFNYILFISIAGSFQQNVCDAPFTDSNNKTVNIDTDCKDKSCLVRCCGHGQVIYVEDYDSYSFVCETIENILKDHPNLNQTMAEMMADYSGMEIYQTNYKERRSSSKKFDDFKVIQSESYRGLLECADFIDKNNLNFVIESGSLVREKLHHYDRWVEYDTALFCVDKIVYIKTENDSNFIYEYGMMVKYEDESVYESKGLYLAITYTISAFFLLLVLIVYSMLHQLRNIQGLLLVAYVATLLVMQTLKAGSLYNIYANGQPDDCTLMSQLLYFSLIACNFWLKIMSFDVWWTFRGSLKHRPIHRRGIRVKFLIYATYAYGAAAAITVFATVMDARIDDLPPSVVVPFFSSCLISQSFIYYLFVPQTILTLTNCLLFMMTIYNIHLLGKEIASFDKTARNKNVKNKNTFWLYLRLSLLMGVSWILELIQFWIKEEHMPLWGFVLMNLYNACTGVVIFFMFVFKTNVFLMLTKRFNIENRWTRRLQATTTSDRTETSKSGKSFSRSYSRTTDSEVEDGAIDSRPGADSVPMHTYRLSQKIDTCV